MSNFMAFNRNYIEVKCFTQAVTSDSTAKAKTANSADIVNDILRLLAFAESNQGRFFLVFFDKPKLKYLTLKKRIWLNELLSPGLKKINFDFTDECKTFMSRLQVELIKPKIAIMVYTYEIRGVLDDSSTGYLINILR
jgi:hypothetical protein